MSAPIPWLRMFPPAVAFTDVEPNTVYNCEVTLRNADTRIHTVKIIKPVTKKFHLQADATTVKLAPGMNTTFEVAFATNTEDNFFDRILIQTEKGTAELSLSAHAPVANVSVQGSLEMGVIVHGSSVSQKLTVANHGPRPATFKVDWDKSLGNTIKVEPPFGEVGPVDGADGGLAQIQVTCAPPEMGAVNTTVEVSVDGAAQPTVFDLNATVVPQSLELLKDEPGGGTLTEMPFGTVFFGDTVKKSCIVYNNGPTPVEFWIKANAEKNLAAAMAAGDDDDGAPKEMSAFGIAARLKGMSKEKQSETLLYEPKSGILAPYSKTRVTFILNPKMSGLTKGFKSQEPSIDKLVKNEQFLGVVSFRGLKKRLKIPITAKATAGVLAMEPQGLDFGPVPVHDIADHLVTIKNVNKELPVDYVIARSTFFKPTPDRGSIPPGQSASVHVRYEPKNLGPHADHLVIKALATDGSLLHESHLGVQGVAHVVGEKVAKPGGTMALPKDFTRDRKYVRPDEVGKATIALSKSARRPALPTLERPEVTERYALLSQGNPMALTLEQATAKATHKSGYVDYIRQSRSKRVHAEKMRTHVRSDPSDPVSLGLDRQSGLRDPGPRLPDPHEPLWMDKTEVDKKYTYIRPRNRPQYLSDEAELGVSLFKEMPTTAQEIKECAKVLIPKEINKLSIGPSTLDFGVVSARSTTTKYFAVTNNLAENILVQMDTSNIKVLKDSAPSSQVVPAGATAGFGMSLCVPDVMQEFKTTVSYTINNAHQFFFDIIADVVPVTLNLNVDDLLFRFAHDNWDSMVTETIIVSNPNSYPAEFSWDVPKGTAFTVSPQTGFVDGRGSLPVQITWTPGTREEENKTILTLDIVGGNSPKTVKCSGEAAEGKLQFREKSLDLKTVSVGVALTRTVTLKNVGQFDAVFSLEPFGENTPIKCEPRLGRIAQGSIAELEVTFNSEEPGVFKIPLVVNVRGGKSVKLMVLVESVVPEVYIKQPEIDFGSVYIGGAVKIPVTMVNNSPIMANLECDLRAYPSFALELPKVNWSTADYEMAPIMKISGNPDSPPKTVSGEREPLPEEGDEPPIGSMYKMSVAPNKELTFNVIFRPSAAFKFTFELPVYLLGIIFEPDPRLCKVVSAEGLKPRVVLGASTIDFGSKIVLREGVKKIPYALDMTLTNNDDTRPEVEWSLGVPIDSASKSDMSSTVKFEPPSGVMARGESVTVRCVFLPYEAVQYQIDAPIYLDGQTETPYVNVEVLGEGTHPRLAFDCREVVLAPTPLGVKTTRRFMVVNKGYDNLEISYKLPPDTEKIPMEVTFPEGMMIGIAKQELPVDVSFVSTKPLSFTASIDFLDDDAKRFPIPVSGTTDNCTLTLEPFIKSNDGALQMSTEEGKPIMLLDDPAADTPTYVAPSAEELDRGVYCHNLARWINAITPKGPVEDIPGDFISSKGRLIIELVEFWSGKPVPGKVTRLSGNKREASEQILGQYEKLLTHLKAHGALLNSVKPEMMLDMEDFSRVIHARMAKISSNGGDPSEADRLGHWAALDASFLQVSSAAWRVVLMQTIKVFVLSRVTPKQFKGMPGLDDKVTAADASLAGSNFYSVSEVILLKWMSYHFAHAMPNDAKRVTNFGADLQSGLVFYSVLANHWPALESFKETLKLEPKTEEDLLANAEAVLAMLHAVNIPYNITASQLLSSTPSEMLLFTVFLYNSLPQLIPKTTIDFTCMLGETVVKNIELTNPSNKTISYSARLEGCADFSIEHSAVRLEPKSSVQLPVQLMPTSSNPTPCRLILSSLREGSGATATTLVFALNPVVLANKPIRSITFNTKCYNIVTSTVDLVNPFPADCEFAVTVQNLDQDKLDAEAAAAAAAAQGGGRGAANEKKKPKKSKLPKIDRSIYPDSFGVDRKTVRCKKGDRVQLNVSYLPFTMGVHTAMITFEDATYGKFVYQCNGTADFPPPMINNKANVNVSAGAHNLMVPYVNAPLEQAKRSFLEKHPLSKFKEQAERIRNAQPWPKSVDYNVQTHSAYMNTLPVVTLIQNPSKPKKEMQQGPDGKPVEVTVPGDNNLVVNLTPKGAGIYPAKLVLTSPYDVRVLNLEYTAEAKDTNASLEFECSARQLIVQEIPLVNSGKSAMSVTSKFEGDSGFTGPKDVVVPAGATVNYPLSFKPGSTGDYAATLTLQTSNNEANAYALKGIVDEPLAESHVVIKAQARKKTTHTFTVPNVYGGEKGATYNAFSDLPFASGDPKCSAKTGGNGYFELTLMPPASGVTHGSLTFTAADGQYVWFTIEVQATPPKEEDVLKLEVPVRKAVTMQITLANPLPTPATFRVLPEGHGLLGAREMSAGPQEEVTYDLVYSPLLVGPAEGAVTFLSPTLGEFWYRLELNGLEPEVTDVPEMTAEVGTRAATILEVDNPLGEEVVLKLGSTNPRNFSFSPAQLLLPAFGSGKFQVEYVPSTLNEVETGIITASNEKAGTWTFDVRGTGTAPTVMDPTEIFTTLGQGGSGMVTFTNPFKYALSLAIDLETSEEPGVFVMMMQRMTGVKVPPFGQLQMPFTFNPTRMSRHEAMLVLSSEGSDLTWRFPIEGMAEAAPSGASFKLAGKARQMLEQIIEVDLNGLSITGREEFYTHEVVAPANERAHLKRALSMRPMQGAITSNTEPLRFAVRFQPQRAMSCTCDLVIAKASGGRWRFPVLLEASEPDFDGTIQVEAQVNTVSEAVFLLANPEAHSSNFAAFFTPDSPAEFAVTPGSGVMPAGPQPTSPRGDSSPRPVASLDSGDGVEFVISYAPKEYGMDKVGRLIIQTEEMQWVFEVIGTSPEYHVPEGRSRVNTRLPGHVAASLVAAKEKPRRNIVRENLKPVNYTAKGIKAPVASAR